MIEKKKTNKKSKHSQTREPWKILYSIPEFKRLIDEGKKNPEKIYQIAEELKSKYKIPIYLRRILSTIMRNNYDAKNLSWACAIELAEEKEAGCHIYKLQVYPETTKEDVVEMFKIVKNRYRKMGFNTKYEDSLNLEVELFAANKKAEGESINDISNDIFKEFEINLSPTEIYSYVKRGKAKQDKFRRI